MKTTVNKKKLIKLGACKDSLEAFVKAHGSKTVSLSQAFESNGWDDTWWLILNSYDQFTDEQKHDLRMLSCAYAKINIEKTKPYCSDEEYEVMVKYLETGDESLRSAARLASKLAAESASKSAAKSAVWSARSAWSAAESAVWSAARSAWSAESAADSAAMKENERMLMNLLLKWESEKC